VTNSKIVIDASIVIKWLTLQKEEKVVEARKVAQLLLQGKIQVWAPSFLLVEVTNILLKKKKMSIEMMDKAIQEIKKTGIQFVDFNVSEIGKLTQLAIQNSLTTYDAMYLLIAKEKKIPLLTLDRQLLKITDMCISLD
jgi:predicted nucleic acid-binding protein